MQGGYWVRQFAWPRVKVDQLDTPSMLSNHWRLPVYHFCRNKHNFVATKVFSQNAYFCCNKRCVLLRQTCVCHNEHVFVMTKHLSQQKLYLWQQLPPMIDVCHPRVVWATGGSALNSKPLFFPQVFSLTAMWNCIKLQAWGMHKDSVKNANDCNPPQCMQPLVFINSECLLWWSL